MYCFYGDAMKRQIPLFFCLLLTIAAGIYLFLFYRWNINEQTINENSAPLLDSLASENTPLPSPVITPRPTVPQHSQQPATFYTYVVGSLKIEDVLMYPVVQYSDNTFFLSHDFQGNPSSYGAIFMDYQNEPHPPDQNTILYGHNMGRASRLMFSRLTRYKSQSFWKNHSTLEFTINDQPTQTCTIFAVCHLPANQAVEYFQKQFVSGSAYLSFIQKIQHNAIYNTGITVPENSHLLTLITCDRSQFGENGRLLVFAFY